MTETVDEFGQRLAVVAHGEHLVRDGLDGMAFGVGFNGDLKGTLVEAANVDLAFLAEDDGLNAIAGDVIAADLDLGNGVFEPAMYRRASSKSSSQVV